MSKCDYGLVTTLQMSKTIQEVRDEDVKSYGRMMVTAALGMEEAEPWFAFEVYPYEATEETTVRYQP